MSTSSIMTKKKTTKLTKIDYAAFLKLTLTSPEDIRNAKRDVSIFPKFSHKTLDSSTFLELRVCNICLLFITHIFEPSEPSK